MPHIAGPHRVAGRIGRSGTSARTPQTPYRMISKGVRCMALSLGSVLFVATLAADMGDISPAQPAIPDRVFRLRDYGSVANAKTLNTAAFSRAISAVGQAGGGTLIVSAGIYFTGPIDLCSGINLHLDAGATILFSSQMAPLADGKFRPLLLTRNAHDVMVSGSGPI